MGMGKHPDHEEDQDLQGGRFQPQCWASRSQRQEMGMALMLHACEPADRTAYPALSWQPPCSWPAWPGVACDLKSLLRRAGSRPDTATTATYVLLHRKHLQVLLTAGSVATSHCQFCTALGLVTTGASLGADMERGVWGAELCNRAAGFWAGPNPMGTLQRAGEGTNPHTQILLQVAMCRDTSSMGQRGAPQPPACILLKTPDCCLPCILDQREGHQLPRQCLPPGNLVRVN